MTYYYYNIHEHDVCMYLISMSSVVFNRVVPLPAEISLSLRTQTHPPQSSLKTKVQYRKHFSGLWPIYLTLKFFRNFSRRFSFISNFLFVCISLNSCLRRGICFYWKTRLFSVFILIDIGNVNLLIPVIFAHQLYSRKINYVIIIGCCHITCVCAVTVSINSVSYLYYVRILIYIV